MKNQNGAIAPAGSACLDLVLDRLTKVKSAGAGKWIACCPAHNDKSPSLNVSEAADGKVLLHCWAGCNARDITAAIGLELADLFPGKREPRRGPSKAAVNHERMVYAVGSSLLQQGQLLNAEDQARFELAKQRLGVK
ncbi:CHC2 zinc finger domain-containing protein [Pseudomonas turukhanskensis]|uniref:Zinc finger CHC2-type domain-containing protein n=1 Tax=Pseudomonas turukhanskensis TaxID=1806536 RepID=A0A9W6NFT3_9PSED|nr:CHC2 zinc finger domain-containing protein [Pseudomonas turukhanskensis]GLK90039.1 hypothetical protein GCM10017655_31010 [Pseudomonas turukhanskensis]